MSRTLTRSTELPAGPGPQRRRFARAARRGFSLLEVILALGILTSAIAVLGELARIGLTNAGMARDYSRAEMLCESKLSEIVAGITPPSSTQSTPCETQFDVSGPQWVYSIDVSSLDQQGLLAVQVTVTQDLSPAQHPVVVSLQRWIQDPNASTSQTSSDQDTSTSTSGTSTSGG